MRDVLRRDEDELAVVVYAAGLDERLEGFLPTHWMGKECRQWVAGNGKEERQS